MFYQEMENIYYMSNELNDSVKLSQSINKLSTDDIKGNDIVPDGAILFKNANNN